MGLGVATRVTKLWNRYRHGPKAVYYRDFIQKRILATPPVLATTDASAEIHTMVWSGDWIVGIWALKSFYFHSQRSYRLCIHEDGTLDPTALSALRQHFPNARVIERSTADARVIPWLDGTTHSQAYRRKGHPFSLKLFDFVHFLESTRMLVVDADVLFFAEPKALLERIEDDGYRLNAFNRDWSYGYSLDEQGLSTTVKFPVPPRINAGLGLLHSDSFEPELVEELLGRPEIHSHPHRIEQTVLAINSAKFGFEFLPPEYDIRMGALRPDQPARHYTGPLRPLFFREGIPALVTAGVLRERIG